MTATAHFRNGTSPRVFLYHAVVSQVPSQLGWRERKYWMTVREFGSHLSFLLSCGHPMQDLASALYPDAPASPLAPAPQPAPAVLTFDDGRACDGQVAWPLLREAGLPATFFVNTATLDRPGHLHWNDVRTMSAEGASFGSHGHHHADFTRMDLRALATELRLSKDLLEGRIGRPVDFFAAPYGRVNERVVDAALAAGYRAVCTSTAGAVLPNAARVPRIAIHAGTPASTLGKWLAGSLGPYWARRARAACLALPKCLIRMPDSETEFPTEAAL